mgnify:CR=1 FL=1
MVGGSFDHQCRIAVAGEILHPVAVTIFGGLISATLLDTLMPDLMPLAGSPALDADFVAVPPDDGFLQPVDFIGAVGPGHDWVLSGWANFSDN